MDIDNDNENLARRSFPDSNVTWYIGNLWANDQTDEILRWQVVKRDQGWALYSVRSNPVAEQADCEVAQGPERDGE